MEFKEFKLWAMESKQLLLELKSHLDDPVQSESILLQYVKCRFLLDELPQITDSIYDLAEVSVSKMAKLPPDQFYQMEQIGGCSGAKSSMIKKILLLMNLKEHLQLTIDEDTLTDIDTVSDLLNVLHYNK